MSSRYKDLNKRRATARAWAAKNREKRLLQRRVWRARNKERLNEYQRRYLEARGGRQTRKAYALKHAYGLSHSEYLDLLYKQDHRCAICRRPESRQRKGQLLALVVDHNHETGKVRGLLCCKCNSALGFLAEDPLRIAALGRYIEQHREA